MKKFIKKFFSEIIFKNHTRFKKRENDEYLSEDKVFCPICKSTFKNFSAFGIVERKNALCLNCGSLERHRLLWKYLNENTPLFDGKETKSLLHIAPEKPFYEIFSKNRRLAYTPCDIDPESYRYNGKIKIIKADITNLEFNDNYFDIILCNHVLEHIQNDRQALHELYRVLKKGAWGIFQVPIDYNRKTTYEDSTLTNPVEREKNFGHPGHVRIYGTDYIERLEEAGFEVKVDDYIKFFTPEELFKFGLIDSELIYKCTKRNSS